MWWGGAGRGRGMGRWRRKEAAATVDAQEVVFTLELEPVRLLQSPCA